MGGGGSRTTRASHRLHQGPRHRGVAEQRDRFGQIWSTDYVVVSEKKLPFGRDWDAFKVAGEQIPPDERDRRVTKVATSPRPIGVS
jgi:hypothetical protein